LVCADFGKYATTPKRRRRNGGPSHERTSDCLLLPMGPLVDDVNRFLEDNSYDVEDVYIQFVTTVWVIDPASAYETVESRYEAFVTHPG
jgi:hypothetical protein